MDETVLVTGASSGLGRATAHEFHANGWNVVAAMRDPRDGAAIDALDRTLVTRMDVTDRASIDSAVAAATMQFGGIDVLVNNAGYGAYGPLEATTEDTIRRQFDVNVIGVLATAQAVLPAMRARRDGAIVNVSSIGGRLAFPLGSLYHGSKFAVEGLSESLAYELATVGVRVKLVEPGGMQTDFGGRSMDFSNDEALTEYQPLVEGVVAALGPMMANGSRPEDVSRVVFAAATDRSDRLRFEAGPDAEQLLADRRAAADDVFLAGMRAQFGL